MHTRNRQQRSARRLTPLVGALILLAASCGGSGDRDEPAGPTTDTTVAGVSTSSTPSTVGTTITATGTAPANDVLVYATTADSDDGEAVATHELPGEHFEGIFGPGAIFGVIGVAVDDQLNIRARPGADQAIVDSLDPLTRGLVFTGRARLLGQPTSVWYEVRAGELVGWVHARFVAPLSATFDITNEIIQSEGGAPTGATVDEIGAIVLDVRSRFADPQPSSMLIDGPTAGDLTEMTYDLVGFGDDSVLGERLHLFIGEADNDGDRLELRRVEVTYLCARGQGGGTDLCP